MLVLKVCIPGYFCQIPTPVLMVCILGNSQRLILRCAYQIILNQIPMLILKVCIIYTRLFFCQFPTLVFNQIILRQISTLVLQVCILFSRVFLSIPNACSQGVHTICQIIFFVNSLRLILTTLFFDKSQCYFLRCAYYITGCFFFFRFSQFWGYHHHHHQVPDLEQTLATMPLQTSLSSDNFKKFKPLLCPPVFSSFYPFLGLHYLTSLSGRAFLHSSMLTSVVVCEQ